MATLPPEFLDINDLTTSSRGVSVLYGRREDGSLVAVKVDDSGYLPITLASIQIEAIELKDPVSSNMANVEPVAGSKNGLGVVPYGSNNSFYSDQTVLALTGSFQQVGPFGFESMCIYIANDSMATDIQYSFDGTHVHGTIKPGKERLMEFRRQPTLYLLGNTAAYRVEVY